MSPLCKPVSVAVMLTPVTDVTDWVVMVNVALLAPNGTVTLAGTVAYADPDPTTLLELRSTTSPPTVVTKWSNWTWPVAVVPPTTKVGVTWTLKTYGLYALRLKVVVNVLLLLVAVIVAD